MVTCLSVSGAQSLSSSSRFRIRTLPAWLSMMPACFTLHRNTARAGQAVGHAVVAGLHSVCSYQLIAALSASNSPCVIHELIEPLLMSCRAVFTLIGLSSDSAPPCSARRRPCRADGRCGMSAGAMLAAKFGDGRGQFAFQGADELGG